MSEPPTWQWYRRVIQADLYRVDGKKGFSALLRELCLGESYKYIFWLRTCRFLRSRALTKWTLYPFARWMLHRYTYKLGIAIPIMTEIGEGLYIGHFGGIVVNRRAILGKNCNLSQGVTIGQLNRGPFKGTPRIGDYVHIGPGAKILGAVTIGNRASIGANAVVTRDVPDHAVAVGIPARVISDQGSDGYVNLTSDEL